MKTDAWISLLATGVEPIGAADRVRARRRDALVLSAGVLVSVVFCLGVLHPNRSFAILVRLPEFWLRETFCALTLALATPPVFALARPGARPPLHPALIGLPILVMAGVAGVWLINAPPSLRYGLIVGHTAAVCPLLISLLALPSGAAYFRVLRAWAPTRPATAGASAGFAAGATGALVYTLHCPELAPPFLASWYVVGMTIPAVLGAILGSRLLRW